MPRVWTLRQPGINSPAPARSRESRASPRRRLGQVVATCGRIVPPEDAHAFADAMLSLASQPELRRELGAKARACAEARFARDAVLERFERDLQTCIDARRAR